METVSKSAEEIENLLHKLETKGSKRNEKCKVNQLHQIGMNLIFLPLKMSHPVHLHQHMIKNVTNHDGVVDIF